VISVDYRLSCIGDERNFSPDVVHLCGWPYQREGLESGQRDVAAQDVEDAIGFVKDNPSMFPSWDGRIAALGTSAGGTVLLDAIADAVANSSEDKPDVTATWSAMMQFADLNSVPVDGFASEDACDHARWYVPPDPDGYDPGRMGGCWWAMDHYMDWTATQQSPYCGFDGPGGEVGPDSTDVPGDCTSDLQSWYDVSPYVTWASATESDFGPMFVANGGGPYIAPPDPYPYEDAETVVITDPVDFYKLLTQTLDWTSDEANLCIVDAPLHGSEYEDYLCDDDATSGHTVFWKTAAFINSQLPP